MKDQLAMLDSALEAARPDQRTTLIREFTKATESRLRFYRADGRRVPDSFASGPPTYTLRDTELQPWNRDAARAMDRGIDRIVRAPISPDLEEPTIDRAAPCPAGVDDGAPRHASSRLHHSLLPTPPYRPSTALRPPHPPT